MGSLSHAFTGAGTCRSVRRLGELGGRRRARVRGVGIVLHAFLSYLEEHPATQRLAGVLTEVLVEQGDLATVEEAVA
jgi:hypothetical protein